MSYRDWFQQLFGFPEGRYDETRRQLVVESGRLRSLVNGASFAIGEFTTPSLADLRHAAAGRARRGTLRVTHEAIGDVLELHARPENAGATFQVASQFNCLEFSSPSCVPEDGVTGYAFDPTQGPACSLAAAAATVYRNYFVPCAGGEGQTHVRQLDNLQGLAAALGPGDPFFEVRNGYTFATAAQLARLDGVLGGRDREQLAGTVRIGLHREVGVTFAARFTPPAGAEPIVSQAFCSAVSCAYSGLDTAPWRPLATLVLDAAYEATLWAAALQAARGRGSNRVWLTLLGGGAFGNEHGWIAAAIRRALVPLAEVDLDVRIAHFRRIDAALVTAVGATL